MTGWTAIVPIKALALRKSRLGLHLGERRILTEAMIDHVLATLDAVPQVAQVTVLAQTRRSGRAWVEDHGRGLNDELSGARCRWADRPFLVVHADLPEVQAGDIAALIAATARGAVGIAPDRHGTGTNALAIPAGVLFQFAFGPDSCARHLAAGNAQLVTRHGLANDIDTLEDLALYRRQPPVRPVNQSPVTRIPVPGTL